MWKPSTVLRLKDWAFRAWTCAGFFGFGLRVSIPMADSRPLDPEQVLLEAFSEESGLPHNDFGREFATAQKQLCVAEVDQVRS
jgi:hypothetical protein